MLTENFRLERFGASLVIWRFRKTVADVPARLKIWEMVLSHDLRAVSSFFRHHITGRSSGLLHCHCWEASEQAGTASCSFVLLGSHMFLRSFEFPWAGRLVTNAELPRFGDG